MLAPYGSRTIRALTPMELALRMAAMIWSDMGSRSSVFAQRWHIPNWWRLQPSTSSVAHGHGMRRVAGRGGTHASGAR